MPANCTVTQGQTGPIIQCTGQGVPNFESVFSHFVDFSTTTNALLTVFAAFALVLFVAGAGSLILETIAPKPKKKRFYYRKKKG